jgi:hypothetical protein
VCAVQYGSGSARARLHKEPQFGSETTLSTGREQSRSRDNISSRARARSAQHSKRLLKPTEKPSKIPVPTPSSRNGSSSSTSASDDLYQRYDKHQPITAQHSSHVVGKQRYQQHQLRQDPAKLAVLQEAEHDYITLGEDGGQLKSGPRESQQELIKVLEKGSWDEETFTKLLMSG